MPELKEQFGRRLKEVRLDRGLTQQQVADALETTVQTISSLERGVHWPSYETLSALLKVLKAKPKELFDF